MHACGKALIVMSEQLVSFPTSDGQMTSALSVPRSCRMVIAVFRERSSLRPGTFADGPREPRSVAWSRGLPRTCRLLQEQKRQVGPGTDTVRGWSASARKMLVATTQQVTFFWGREKRVSPGLCKFLHLFPLVREQTLQQPI